MELHGGVIRDMESRLARLAALRQRPMGGVGPRDKEASPTAAPRPLTAAAAAAKQPIPQLQAKPGGTYVAAGSTRRG